MSPADPLAELLRDHQEHWRLCEWLEDIADSLPNDVNPGLCRDVAAMLRDEMPLHHRSEEEGLFPLLLARAYDEDQAEAIVMRLCEEHVNDEGFAEELVDILERLAEGAEADNPNMLGYMLRGFFENYRRHIHWENTVLIPLARRRLTEADLDVLANKMARFRSRRRGD